MQTRPHGPRTVRARGRAPLLVAAAILLLAAGASALLAAGKAAIQPSFNAYFPTDFKDAAYQKNAVAKVSKNWVVPAAHLPAKGTKTVVQATIVRDGSLGAALVTMKSGSKEWDEAALAAVTKGAPFGPLPGGYPQSKIEVHWHFSAN